MLMRFLGLLLQLILVFGAADLFALTIDTSALIWVMGIEAGLLLLLQLYHHRWSRNHLLLFATLSLDVLLWSLWLAFSGGASNAFISLLLLPVVLAAVLLPLWAPCLLATLTVLAYSGMIFLSPFSTSAHGGMHGHYLGMWCNFVVTVLVITTIAALLIRRQRQQDAHLAVVRETQLRHTQLLALGTLSAQMSHQLATPLASLRLLLEELQEDSGYASMEREKTPYQCSRFSAVSPHERTGGRDNGAGHGDDTAALHSQATLEQMSAVLHRCEQTLTELRQGTQAIRCGKQQCCSVASLQQALQQQLLLMMPELDIRWQCRLSNSDGARELATDPHLLPALMSLVENAAHASQEAGLGPRVDINLFINEQALLLIVRDYGPGLTQEQLNRLGVTLTPSEKGLGVALVLTHASFERLNGRLVLRSVSAAGDAIAIEDKTGVTAEVTLPLLSSNGWAGGRDGTAR